MVYTYKGIKRAVLSLIRQYTIAGDAVLTSYNNQADYENQIAQRFNEGLVEIRTTVKPDAVELELNEPNEYHGMRQYDLPRDFMSLKSGSIRVAWAGHLVPAVHNKVEIFGKTILVPNDGQDYLMEYYRYPPQFSDDPKDTNVIDEDPDVVQAAIYYAAAQLVRMDSAYDFAALNNEYADRAARMRPIMYAETDSVVDLYGGGWHGLR